MSYIRPCSRSCVTLRNMLLFYGKGLSSPPKPDVGTHTQRRLSGACLFGRLYSQLPSTLDAVDISNEEFLDIPKHILSNSMQQSIYWKANNSSASHEVVCYLSKLNDHYPINTSPPVVPIQSDMNTLHTIQSYFLKPILILFSHPRSRQHRSTTHAVQTVMIKLLLQQSYLHHLSVYLSNLVNLI